MGYMVRGKSVGFITASTGLQTIAHELGHGIGALSHTWNDNGPEQGSTDNLMDYSSNENLIGQQWEELRNPNGSSFWDDEEDAESIATNLYWSEDNSLTKSSETKILKYGHKSSFLTLKLNKSALGKKVTVKVYADDELAKTREFEIKTTSLTQKFEINIGIKEYIVSDADDIVSFSAIVSIPKVALIKTKENDELKVHAVIFIPEIMKKKGWTLGVKCQEQWFNDKKNNYPWEGQFKINNFSWTFAMKELDLKTIYENAMSTNKWQGYEQQKLLSEKILELVSLKVFSLPTENNKTVSFSCAKTDVVFETITPEELGEIKTYCKVPFCEKYYFCNSSYKKDTKLNDFGAGIGKCNIRWVCDFTLTYQSDESIQVNITKLYSFVQDQFDYVGDQSLGLWSLNEMDVSDSKFDLVDGDYRVVNNQSYKDYRVSSQMGGDFYQYSAFSLGKSVDFKFNLIK